MWNKASAELVGFLFQACIQNLKTMLPMFSSCYMRSWVCDPNTTACQCFTTDSFFSCHPSRREISPTGEFCFLLIVFRIQLSDSITNGFINTIKPCTQACFCHCFCYALKQVSFQVHSVFIHKWSSAVIFLWLMVSSCGCIFKASALSLGFTQYAILSKSHWQFTLRNNCFLKAYIFVCM